MCPRVYNLNFCASWSRDRCTPSSPAYRPTPLQPPVAVRMVEVPGAFNAGIYLAHQRGYFREEGLELSLDQFDTSERLLPALRLVNVAPFDKPVLDLGF